MKAVILHTVPPAAGNPRNSEGAFAELPDGRLAFVYSRFTGGSHDNAASDLAVIFSKDSGKSWSEPRIILRAEDLGTENVMSVSLMHMADGSIGVFFCKKLRGDFDGAIDICLARTRDGFETLGEVVSCVNGQRMVRYILNNDRAERLPDGRILLPLAVHIVRNNGRLFGDDWRSGGIVFYASSDDGASWNELRCRMDMACSRSRSGLQEPGAVAFADGTVWAYARSDMGFQYESFSHDGMRTLTQAEPSRFTSPCSPMKIKRDPYSGELTAVWNPQPDWNGRPRVGLGSDRTPLVCAFSADEGQSWSEPQIIDDDPGRGYCYPGIHFLSAGVFLVSACAGGPEDGGQLNRTNIYRVEKQKV